MLTIEEQIERIADHAFERASVPVRTPRRWPAMAAAAALLVVAGSVFWAVTSRGQDAGSAVAPGSPSTSPKVETGFSLSDIESVVVRQIEDPPDLAVAGIIRVDFGDAPALVGMPVVNDLGLVGKVLSVDRGIASVQLVTADGFSIGAAAEVDNEIRRTGVVFGTGDSDQVTFLRIEDSEEETEIPLGTIVVTAGGTNSISPSGIRIGRVASSASSSEPGTRHNAIDPSWDDAPDSELRILLYVPSGRATSLPEIPREGAVSPAALELDDPSSFGLVEFEDPDATQAVFCSSYSQSLAVECEAFTGTARRSYSDPELPDAPFTVDVTTAFVEDPPTDLDAVFYAPGEITSSSQVVVRGTRGELNVDLDGREVIVWEERPGAIARVTFENRPADIDPIEIANALIDDPGQSDEVPYVAIELRGSGDDGALRSLVVLHREGPAECVSVDWVTASNASGVCTTEPLTWWSTVSSLEPGVRGDRDVVFGLAPSDATQVELSVDGDDVITLDTTGVPGFSHRAWAYVIPTQQGTRFTATLTAGTNRVDIDFVHPIVNVDDLCAAVDYGAVVPPVVGLPMYEAADALRTAGVLLADRLRGDPGQVVLAQNPPAGTEIGCGDTQLTVGTPAASSPTTVPQVRVAPEEAVGPVEVCNTYPLAVGDFPLSVADRFDVSMESLMAANEDNPAYDSWFAGSVINIPCGPGRP